MAKKKEKEMLIPAGGATGVCAYMCVTIRVSGSVSESSIDKQRCCFM